MISAAHTFIMRRDNATVLQRRPEAPTMTWGDVLADRQARGLDLPAIAPSAPPRAPAKAKKAPKAPKAPRLVNVEGAEVDARDPRNVIPHTAPMHTGDKPRTAASAASARRKAMERCACRLCALALAPAKTFAEHAAFGLGAIFGESIQAVYGAPMLHRPSTHDATKEALKARKGSDEDAAAREVNTGRDVFGNVVTR